MNKSSKWVQPVVWGLLLAGWLSLLFFFSSQSYEQQSIQPLLRQHFSSAQLVHWLPDITITYRNIVVNSHESPFNFIEFIFRKGAHLFVYATFASIVLMFARSFNPRKLFRAIAAALVISFVVPALDELNQYHGSGRTGNMTDVWLDFTGACAGILACLLVIGVARLLRRR